MFKLLVLSALCAIAAAKPGVIYHSPLAHEIPTAVSHSSRTDVIHEPVVAHTAYAAPLTHVAHVAHPAPVSHVAHVEHSVPVAHHVSHVAHSAPIAHSVGHIAHTPAVHSYGHLGYGTHHLNHINHIGHLGYAGHYGHYY